MDWCMANIGIGAPRIKDSMTDPSTQVDVDEGKTTPESATASQSRHPDSATMSSEEDVLNPSDLAKSIKKLPYSLPSPLFSPPTDTTNYPLSLLSPQSYFSLPTLLLSLIDSPAYSNLTTRFLADFNQRTRDDPTVSFTTALSYFRHHLYM
jgi:triacylglycerol lipase